MSNKQKRKRIAEDEDPDYDPDEINDPDISDYLVSKELLDTISYERTGLNNLQTEKEISKIKMELKTTEPNIVDILKAQILTTDKTELFQLYEVYNSITEPSLSKLELRKEIKNKIEEAKLKFKHYKKYTTKEHETITKELELLETFDEKKDMKVSIANLPATLENKSLIYKEYKRYMEISFSNEESQKLKNWLNWSLLLPHNKVTEIKKEKISEFLQKVNDKLNEELHGMEKVKEQILLFLNSRLLNPNMKNCSLGLLGPPGCGKTTVARILADLLNLPLQQISLGGTMSSEFLKGHQYTYIGSEPGEIVKCLARMKVKNGILFFDEYDKIESKDVKSTLLHITDPSQNSKYHDNYLSGIDIDLSHLWFFYSMNNKPTDNALADRIFFINIAGYSKQDKINIIKNYILKKAHKNMNWNPNSFTISDSALDHLVDKVSPSEPGIRTLEHNINTIVNKINFLFHNQDSKGKTKIKTSFNIGKKIEFPFCLGKDKIDLFLD